MRPKENSEPESKDLASEPQRMKLAARVTSIQIKPDQKVNHHKLITEQKYELNRLKLENLEFQTSKRSYDDKIRELKEQLEHAN